MLLKIKKKTVGEKKIKHRQSRSKEKRKERNGNESKKCESSVLSEKKYVSTSVSAVKE